MSLDHQTTHAKSGFFPPKSAHTKKTLVHPLIVAILESAYSSAPVSFSLDLLKQDTRAVHLTPTQQTVFEGYQSFINRILEEKNAPVDLSKDPLALILVIIASSQRPHASQEFFGKTPLVANAALLQLFGTYQRLMEAFKASGYPAPKELALNHKEVDALATELNLAHNNAVIDAIQITKTEKLAQNAS